jgi:hypothetical protein
LLFSDNQKSGDHKILAKRDHRHDHQLATGRRFTLRLPLPFSSRLSRNSQGLLTYALVRDGLRARKAAPESNGPITIKSWLRYAEKRVPELYQNIRAGRLKVVGFDAPDTKRQLVARDSSVNPAFYTETAKNAQTPALFDFLQTIKRPYRGPQAVSPVFSLYPDARVFHAR